MISMRRRLLLENPSSYVEFERSTLDEGAFLVEPPAADVDLARRRILVQAALAVGFTYAYLRAARDA